MSGVGVIDAIGQHPGPTPSSSQFRLGIFSERG
jgi:hypothetical protein